VLEDLETGFKIVERTARVGLDLAEASLEKKARWFYIWCGDITGEIGEVIKLPSIPSHPKVLEEVGDVLWGISAIAMLCEITPQDIYAVHIEAHQEPSNLFDCVLQSLELLDYGKKVCRDGLEVRKLDRDFVLWQLALIYAFIEAHYNIAMAFEAVNQKLLFRYPNGYTPQASVDRVDVGGRS
jgi:NTP pyrophosphatase (non-canonical NTP hydrolase)